MRKQIPYDEVKFKTLAGDCTAEYINYMPRGRDGMRCWEIKAQKPDGEAVIVVLRDYGYKTSGEVIKIEPFTDRNGRNEEIYRLYNEHKISQVFLAKFFNITQPSVSVIVNGKR